MRVSYKPGVTVSYDFVPFNNLIDMTVYIDMDEKYHNDVKSVLAELKWDALNKGYYVDVDYLIHKDNTAIIIDMTIKKI